MNAIEELRREHDAILQMLRILDKFTVGVEGGGPSETEDGEEIVDFLRTFGDRCHHAKEEECLFPLLERLGMSRENGPIGIMLDEHREARAIVNAMAEALVRYRNGDVGARGVFGHSSRSYNDLMRAHIRKENEVLLVMAAEIITDEHQQSLAEAFEGIEDRLGPGTHDEFHRLLQRLENKYLGEIRMEPDYGTVRRSVAPGERKGESL